MKVVAGISLKNLCPRVWDPASEYHLPGLTAIMVSYADFARLRAKRRLAMQIGLADFLNAPANIEVYLDNGAFYFATNGGQPDSREYLQFIRMARPAWRPIRFDAIPAPGMSAKKQRACYETTMRINRAYAHDGFVPVVHVGKHLGDYLKNISASERLSQKPAIALGGLVPMLLRSPKAAAYGTILDDLVAVREKFKEKSVHVFGIGGTATLHLAAILGFDSVDSSGWRNRAARGIIQLPGSGERLVADLGSWRGRKPTDREWDLLNNCGCPACRRFGSNGLCVNGLAGFGNRATHNLWVLLQEAAWIARRLANRNYIQYYRRRLDNTVYRPLIETLIERLPVSRRRRLGG